MFKVGDKVFDIRMGWGKVVKEYDTIIDVKFKKDLINSYYNDGRDVDSDLVPLLSFTKYTLQGFTQKK